MKIYSEQAKKYLTLTQNDPIKEFSQRPTILSLLGNLGKNVLDIGCGNGILDQLLINNGYCVVGFDNSKEQIILAKQNCPKGRLFMADQNSFSCEKKFDCVIAVLVLMHSKNNKELLHFFQCAKDNLKPSGKFVGMVYNENFNHFNSPYYGRIWRKLPNQKIEVSFLNPNNKLLTKTTARNIGHTEYGATANAVGFNKLTWHPLVITKEGLNTLGDDYWSEYKQDCPYTCFIAS